MGSGIPGHFIDIISNVFKTSRIENLYSHLDSNRLFHLCQTWPSLTTLRTARYEYSPADIPPDALPQLCHLEANTRTICHIAPGGPIETLCHVGEVICWKNDFELFASVVRGCGTLQRARVNCRIDSEDVDILSAFAHDALRFFHLRITLDDRRGSFRLTPSLVIQALPSGALALFPKLEVLQIILSHVDFAIVVDNLNYGEVEDALMSLIPEGHATLHQVDVDCSFYSGAIRFRAARHDGRWHVKTVIHEGPESSILTRFEDVLAGHR